MSKYADVEVHLLTVW